MKITFNPIIKQQQTYFNKPNKTTSIQIQAQSNLLKLEHVGNYNLFFGRNPKAIYSIDYEGNCEKFESVQAAKDKHSSVVSRILKGDISASNNKTYVYADYIELPDGKINPNALWKSLLAFRDAKSQPVYSIDYYGNIKKYNNAKDASNPLGITESNINRVLNQTNLATRGYVFISAFDVEMRNKNGKLLKDENGKPIIDIKAINKARENFLKTGTNYPIVQIDKNGNITRFRSIKEASEKTSDSTNAIAHSLSMGRKCQKKYIYVRLEHVVLVDENGDVMCDENNDFAIDYDKLERARRTTFQN